MTRQVITAVMILGCGALVSPQKVLGNSAHASFRDVSVSVVANGSDSAQVVVTGEARVTGTVASHLRLPDTFSLSSSEQELDSTTVSANSTFSFSWQIHAVDDGTYLVDAVLLMTPSDTTECNWFNSYACYVTVENGLITEGSMELPSEFATSEFDTTIASTYQTEESGSQTITVSLTGDVVYSKDCYGGPASRNVPVPGVKVYIDWDGDNSPAEQWKPYFPGTYTTEHRDFATTDENGVFTFNFTFQSSKDISELATQLRFWSGTRNDAAITGPATALGPWPMYFVDGLIPIIRTQGLTDQLVSSNVRITIPAFNGASLRNLWRAKRYCQAKLAVSPGQIVYVQGDGDVSYYNGTNIVFVGTPETETAYHEYGHYVDNLYDGQPSTSGEDHWWEKETDVNAAWVEGWAEYFSAVVHEFWHVKEPNHGDERTTRSPKSRFLDQSTPQAALAQLPSSVDRHAVEGIVATILYSLHDSYSGRALPIDAPGYDEHGYVGDNDDIHIWDIDILQAATTAGSGDYGTSYLAGLQAEIKERLPQSAGVSVDKLFNFYVAKQGFPPSPNPQIVSVIKTTNGPQLTLKSNNSPDLIYIGGLDCTTISFSPYYKNYPSEYRVYRRLSDATWTDGLSGYTRVATVDPTTTVWDDESYVDGPASYIVVSRNGIAGESHSEFESRIVPPAYFHAPAVGQTVSDDVDIVASVRPLTAISGFNYSSSPDSFAVEWGSGSSPVAWHRYGMHNVVTSPTAYHQTVAKWNTGVVPNGDYTIRIFVHLGSQTYETRRIVTVEHRKTLVASTGGSFTSIQPAINWAQMGDTVFVSAGVYPNTSAAPTLTLKQTVHLIGIGGTVEIRPYGNNAIMSVSGHEYPAQIDTLTFTRTTPSTSGASYGIVVSDSPFKIVHCTFAGLQASIGCAVKASGKSNVVLDDCAFENSQVYSTSLGSVVDFQATSNGKPTGAITRCTFSDNDVPPVSIAYLSSSPLQNSEPKPFLENCTFKGNHTGDFVVRISNSLRTINFFSCTLVDNELHSSAGTPGAAIYCDNAKVFLDNCTIANNVGTNTDAGAVSIGSTGSSPVNIEDSIVAFNDGAVVNKTNSGMPSDVSLNRCVVYSNAAGSYRSDAQWATSGTNVYAENPAFYDAPNGDYSLYCFSPAARGANDESGLHFTTTIGAQYAPIHTPSATVTVTAGQLANGVLLGCPGGEATYQSTTMDHLTITVNLDDNVMTRAISGSELSILPPYLNSGIASTTKIRGSAQAEGNAGNGYTVTLANPNLSGSGVDQATICLDGYGLGQTATISRRTPDYKSAGAPGPATCAGDDECADGKVSNADWSWFVTHYPTGGNPGATYIAAADYVTPFGSPITFADLSWFVGHYTGAGHKVSSTDTPLLLTGDPEQVSTTHVEFGFSEEYLTALQHRLYVDLTLEDCAGKNWCAFAIKTNRSDLSLSSWQPTSWAATSAPFVPIASDDGLLLFFGVIMLNDADETSRQLGRLVFDVEGSDPVTIGSDQFVLTMGELEIATNPDGEALVYSGAPIFEHMSGVAGRQLNSTVQQVFRNSLTQNFPNPFNPQTTLAYSLHEAANVTLAIYDVAGRRVRELVNEHRPAGAYKVVWDGTDAKGSKVASGVYFYKLVAGDFVETKKMVMLK